MSDLNPGEFDTVETLSEFAQGMLDTISDWETADVMSAKGSSQHASLRNGCTREPGGVA